MTINFKPHIPILFTDTETFSEVDIKTAGTVKYANSAELLLAGFKIDDKYDVYDYSDPSMNQIPEWVREWVADGGQVAAHNALFDYCVLKPHIPELQISQMIDTQAMVAACGLPLSLEKAGKALGLPQDVQKLKDGKRLITRFCIPRKPTKHNSSTRNKPADHPKDWKLFRDEYLRLDIEAMIEVYIRVPNLTKREQQVWVETQEINLAGVPIDADTVNHIIEKLDILVDEESTKFIRLTGLFPTQRDRVLDWVRSQGVPIMNLQAATVQDVLASPDTPDIVRQALEHRANTAHMSFKKFPVFRDAMCDDGTVKGAHFYHAAHTGRFGGRLIQTQNLTKGSIDTEEAVERIKDGEFTVELVKSAVRGMIYHPEGVTIVDYAGVEARGVQWVAKDEAALEIFRSGQDPYIWMASKIYGVPYDEVNPKQRFTGKQAILGLGYQMSARKFIMMVESYGETISSEEATLAVKIYRETHKKLVAFWASIQRAAVMALTRPGTRIKCNSNVSFLYQGSFLHMQLPSGRSIKYYKPKREVNSWGDSSFSFMGVNEKNQFVRVHTYGGKLTENLVQGLCRDLLVEAVTNLRNAGYNIITHIHDEVVIQGTHDPDEIGKIMCDSPSWAAGFPVATEGFNSTRFKKG